MLKTVVVLTLLLVVVKVIATPMYTRPSAVYEDQRVIRQEAACAVQGGMCQEMRNCNPAEIVRVADLCPQQSHLGIVCCYYH